MVYAKEKGMEKVTIIGAGLTGALLALYLARRGYEVDVYDARPDPQMTKPDQGRSINLAMSCRGLTGLAGVDLSIKAEAIMVPMRARAIHDQEGGIRYQPFGRSEDEYINAVARTDLNNLLLKEAHQFPSVIFHFNTKLLKVDIYSRQLSFEKEDGSQFTIPYQRLMGADGATSVVRETLVNEKMITSSRNYLTHGYKELSISTESAKELSHENLHLWPRDSFLLLGNPNRDYSITGSLFLPHEGKNSFAKLDNELTIARFFAQAFPDAYKAMPAVVEEFTQHPTGTMSTINSSNWHYGDQCLLIGDAAHGVVPFFGQGMNCGFEDCRLLNEMLDRYDDDWQKVMPLFFAERKPDTDAVAQMSLGNFHEIQSKIRDPQFNLKKQLELELMQRYPADYVSKHVLVMFTNTPYSVAHAVGAVQSELLSNITQGIRSMHEVKWNEVDSLILKYDKKLTDLNLYEKIYQ